LQVLKLLSNGLKQVTALLKIVTQLLERILETSIIVTQTSNTIQVLILLIFSIPDYITCLLATIIVQIIRWN
jgi:hypothetical protein